MGVRGHVTVIWHVLQVFDLLMGEGGQDMVAKLRRNTKWFRERMTSAGFNIKVCSDL